LHSATGAASRAPVAGRGGLRAGRPCGQPLCGTPTGNTCPLYHVNVRGQSDTSRVFNVNAQAGFSAPGAYGGAVLHASLTLSLTSGYAATATARAT
jgi:hypothetical protein